MNIQEAVKQALEKDLCIARFYEDQEYKMIAMIKPLSTGSKVMYAYNSDGELKVENWNPTKGDLISDNWDVIPDEIGLKTLKKQLIKKWWEK